MTTKLSIEIFETINDNLLANVAAIIGNHNSGKHYMSLDELSGYIKGFASRYNYKQWDMEQTGSILFLSCDNNPFFTITEKQLTELNTTTEMDLVTTLS